MSRKHRERKVFVPWAEFSPGLSARRSYLSSLSSIPFGTLASPVPKFATSCTPHAQFQLLSARALNPRSLISATCTWSGAEEICGLLQNIEILSYSPVPGCREAFSAVPRFLQISPDHRRCVENPGMAIAPSRAIVALRPRRNRRLLAVRRESRSSVVSPHLVVFVDSEPGTIVGASTSGSVKYVGTVLPLCPLVPGHICTGDPIAPVLA